MNKKNPAIVVFSGGQDSTTCLVWALRNFGEVRAITFDYGQRHKRELGCARKIAKKLSVPLKVIKMDMFSKLTKNALTDRKQAITKQEGGGLPSTFVPGSNHVFLSTVAIYAYQLGIHNLVAGICQTDYSGYPDCRDKFVKSLEKTLSLAMDYEFKIHAPLMFLTKKETVKLMKKLGGIELLKLTNTCYEGGGKACGKCPACELRLKGFSEAGVADPLTYI